MVTQDSTIAEKIRMIRDHGQAKKYFHDLEGYPAHVANCGDLNLFAEPAIADELAWTGFTMMSVANNHAGDYGPQGLLATMENLERVAAAGVDMIVSGSAIFGSGDVRGTTQKMVRILAELAERERSC